MTAGQLATVTGLPRERIAPKLSELVKTGEFVKGDRGYTTAAGDGAAATSAIAATPGSGAEQREKSPAAVAVGRELDAGLRTRV